MPKKATYPRDYRGHNIERLHPSGYYEFYCGKQQRFLKFDDIGMCNPCKTRLLHLQPVRRPQPGEVPRLGARPGDPGPQRPP
jgi:hypothetical protein